MFREIEGIERHLVTCYNCGQELDRNLDNPKKIMEKWFCSDKDCVEYVFETSFDDSLGMRKVENMFIESLSLEV